MKQIVLIVNNTKHIIKVDLDKPLLWVLREELGLTGSKYGCGIGQCGACTVHLDDIPVRSCSIPVSSIGDSLIMTIEYFSEKKRHSIIKAWKEENVPQCGYCQSGQLMSAIALVTKNKNPSDSDIDNAMSGNICRCGTYFRIKKAIQIATKNKMR